MVRTGDFFHRDKYADMWFKQLATIVIVEVMLGNSPSSEATLDNTPMEKADERAGVKLGF